MKDDLTKLQELIQTIKILRGPEGCPWDQKQSDLSLSKYILEECEELLESIHEKNDQAICEELGDLIFTILMLVEIKNDQGKFNFNDVLTRINEKLIRRHPHVFAGQPTGDEESLKKQWESIKLMEKERKRN